MVGFSCRCTLPFLNFPEATALAYASSMRSAMSPAHRWRYRMRLVRSRWPVTFGNPCS
jgi:hypothetical protein